MAQKIRFAGNGQTFNAIIYDFNRKIFEAYDVLPYLINALNNEKKDFKDKKDLKSAIISAARYQYWARCEYEVILGSWPPSDVAQKIDIFWQISLNIDLLTDLIDEKCRKKTRRQTKKKEEEPKE